MTDPNETPIAAYCQICGKPLTANEVRSVGGVIYCEACLQERLRTTQPTPAAGPTPGGGWAPVAAPGQSAYARVPVGGQQGAPSPVIAGLLGIVPGVGAMYNGQFVKALLHVVVFIVLIGATEHFDLAWILLVTWIIYQIFDAAQTAAARRDGRPLPDPLGLLDLSQRLGPQAGVPPTTVPPPANPYAAAPPPPQTPPQAPYTASAPGAAPDWKPWGEHTAAETAARSTGVPFTSQPPYPGQQPPYQGSQPPFGGPAPDPRYANFAPGGYTPVPPAPPAGWTNRRSEPIGAIVLIAVGVLFLLSTLNVLSAAWIGHWWPLLLLLLGLGLLVRRLRTPMMVPPPPPMPGPYPPPAPPTTDLPRKENTWADTSDTGTKEDQQ